MISCCLPLRAIHLPGWTVERELTQVTAQSIQLVQGRDAYYDHQNPSYRNRDPQMTVILKQLIRGIHIAFPPFYRILRPALFITFPSPCSFQVSNILYLDSPCGVGLSYSDDPKNYETGDFQTATDTHTFLLKVCNLPEIALYNSFSEEGIILKSFVLIRAKHFRSPFLGISGSSCTRSSCPTPFTFQESRMLEFTYRHLLLKW